MAEPWLYRWSRPLMGAIALLGLLLTVYLTWAELTGQTLICPITANGSDCNDVLNSAYGQLWGIPVSAFGAGAYGVMALAAFVPLAISGPRRQINALTWRVLLVGALIMATFSGYLMAILALQIHSFCPYCLASALFAFTLLGLSLFGHPWPDLGQLLATGGIVVVLTLVLTLGVYSQAHPPVMALGDRQPIPTLNSRPQPGKGWPISTRSGPAELALAAHLQTIGAKMYGAFWCPHCGEQKLLFGQAAFAQIHYIECAQGGHNAQPDRCRAAGLEAYPSWEINGQLHTGLYSLDDLAQLSGYTGPANFRYFHPNLN